MRQLDNDVQSIYEILARLDAHDTRFDAIDTRLDNLDTKLDRVIALVSGGRDGR